MVFRRKVVREIPENFQDAQEIAELMRARKLLEAYASTWRELTRKLRVDIYLDNNIPGEDKEFVYRTILEGVVRVIERGGLLVADTAIRRSVSELLRDIAALLEGKKRALVEEKAAELANTVSSDHEPLVQLFETLKRAGLDMYKDIVGDNNIPSSDKRNVWRATFNTYVEMISAGQIPALEMILARHAHALAYATRIVLEAGEA